MSQRSFLAATRDSYDAIAADYADWLRTDMDERPLDRALLGAFAERVRGTGNPRVADVGCGPGRVTVLLERLGLDAFGIDLSPGMVALARRTYPGLDFEVGSMLGLPLPDESLGGVLSYYSIIHVPWEQRRDVFAEFHRVLAPGGQLMVAFQIGDERLHRDEAFGKSVDLVFHRQQPDDVAALLTAADFGLWSTLVKQPEGIDKTPQGIVLAVKQPPAPHDAGTGAVPS
ncbi:class I SAM-dependent methyltransferase [Krasilnikovia sp. MM14-A1259]|uniref:class I SAM-dependent methyltransferase n=1 Tax=Krasilnikovia sp. MM14-A1259 TaxID=3373539 RepID=UPI00399C7986